MNNMENEDENYGYEYPPRPKHDTGNWIIISSIIIGVTMLASSITYAVVARKYPAPAVPAVQNAVDQGTYAPAGNGYAAPSCGVQ